MQIGDLASSVLSGVAALFQVYTDIKHKDAWLKEFALRLARFCEALVGAQRAFAEPGAHRGFFDEAEQRLARAHRLVLNLRDQKWYEDALLGGKEEVLASQAEIQQLLDNALFSMQAAAKQQLNGMDGKLNSVDDRLIGMDDKLEKVMNLVKLSKLEADSHKSDGNDSGDESELRKKLNPFSMTESLKSHLEVCIVLNLPSL